MAPVLTARSGYQDRRNELLPAELLPWFDDRFVESCDLIEQFTLALTLEVLQRCELEPVFAAGSSIAEAIEHRGLKREAAEVPLDWMLRLLCAHGFVERQTDRSPSRYRNLGAWKSDGPELLRQRQAVLDPNALPAYRIAEIAAAGYPAFLRGEQSGDEVLFQANTFDAWPEYFSNQNPLYGINNRVAAAAALGWRNGPIGRVLELGGGMGSAAVALIDAIKAAQRLDTLSSYWFSDSSPVFLRRGQRALTAAIGTAAATSFQRVDIDLPLQAQGIGPASVDLIYAVNVLHVARDLDATLSELHRAVAPGGWVVLGECMRPDRDSALYTEFVFQLLLPFRAPVLDPVARPHGGFLQPEDWQRLLSRAGFGRVEIYPDLGRIFATYPDFVVGAIGAQRRTS